MNAKGPEEKPRSAWAEALRISDLGLRLVASVGILAALGLWLDRRLAWTTFPAFALAGAFLGFGGGMVALVRGLTREPPRGGRVESRGDGSQSAADREERRE